jgi:2-keto-4-pentenoate hydratase/2-oxohepta-3-ene-1,7-dioic acid hydratase in catechol pathway
VFTKFASSITGPFSTIQLSGPRVDWEAELVVVIGRAGRHIARAQALDHVAGVTVGQDLSDRTTQNAGRPPQFSLGKSYEGYAPVGPWVVTLDELPSRDAGGLRITCDIVDADTGERRRVQDGTSSDMVFGVEELIVRLSAIVELFPGDLIFTGTPAGVGIGRDPQEFLSPGDVLVTEIDHIGTIRQSFG